MYAIIRTYTGTPELADQLAARAGEIEEIISSVEGFKKYFLVRTDDGCSTISVFEDEAGAQESTRRAAQWLRENASEVKSSPPAITTGDVVVHFGAKARV